MIFVLWNGGTNYSPGDLSTDLEQFTSMAAAAEALRDRADNGHWCPQDFHYLDREPASNLTPNADADPSMTVWFYDPRDVTDPYPDREIKIGPRGGIQINRT